MTYPFVFRRSESVQREAAAQDAARHRCRRIPLDDAMNQDSDPVAAMQSPDSQQMPAGPSSTSVPSAATASTAAPSTALSLAPQSAADPAQRIDQRLGELNSLLERLERPDTANSAELDAGSAVENFLVQARLGMAGGLYLALRCKHTPTASHSLRVALGCSAWATALNLPESTRDAIEVAALLHDVGKIGVPDRVLLKPGPLTSDETVLMERFRAMTHQVLAACSASEEVLGIVDHSAAWYDGSRNGGNPAGEQIPLGSRLIAIMDAFDSMTCSQIYRPALSHERAVKELLSAAGTQFDPRLVGCFADLQEHDMKRLHRRMAARWLQALDPAASSSSWRPWIPTDGLPMVAEENLFQQKLLDNMYDGVVFLDGDLQITLWNRGVERLTGIEAQAVLHRHFIPTMLSMRDQNGARFRDCECPVAHALQTGVQSRLRLTMRGRNHDDVAIDAHIIPVASADGTLHGVTLLLHDASPETSLEERCQALHEKAIRDPLTQLANRAEFDRVQGLFIEAHSQRGLPCSLIICDIDHFKNVNDNWGHPAGDDVIRSFAQLLKSSCRSGDLVARYGGEEFVMLCADCNVATAFDRAESIRRAFAALPQQALGGRNVTASFGVTQTQPGDTSATLLNRADRALLTAKDSGRNLVVQLGAGGDTGYQPARPWWKFWQSAPADALLEQDLITTVPLKVTIEKLRGFVADQSAQVLTIEDSRICMMIQGGPIQFNRRSGDRGTPLILELSLAEEQVRGVNPPTSAGGSVTRTRIHAVVRPKRNRDRRRAGALERARRLLSSLRSYLMATESHGQAGEDANVLRRATHMVVPWILNKDERR